MKNEIINKVPSFYYFYFNTIFFFEFGRTNWVNLHMVEKIAKKFFSFDFEVFGKVQGLIKINNYILSIIYYLRIERLETKNEKEIDVLDYKKFTIERD